MNPSLAQQLLNPKSVAKEKSKKRTPNYGPPQSRKPANTAARASNDVAVNSPKFDPRLLLNPRGAGAGGSVKSSAKDDTSAADSTVQYASNHDDTDGEGRGMSHFINDLHRITERDSVPQRKRKVDANDEGEEPEQKKAKGNFSIPANDGIVGAHMKAERERVAAQNGPQSMIDLTGEDGNTSTDIVMTGERQLPAQNPSNQEVCLGVLQADANISRIPTYSERSLVAIGTDAWPRLRLDYRRDPAENLKIVLVDKSKARDIGHVAFKYAAALCPLLDGQNINKIRMTVYLDSWRRSKNQVSGEWISENLHISVVLYAPRKYASAIGRVLSQRQLFLSSPTTMGIMTGKEVANPHVPTNFGARGGESKSQTAQHATVHRSEEEIRRDTETMFDSLVKHEDLPEMEPNSGIIKTPLLAHQKQALHFMVTHEHADSLAAGQPSSSLWQSRINPRGQQIWVNVITGHEMFHQPEPTRGGILADMMGLGKTLSILSLIAQTMSEAKEFSRQDPPDESSVECNVKGTLIICPKSVMSNWQEQIQQHVQKGALTFYNYHGASRTNDPEELAKYDVVLTTYNTAAFDFNAKDRALGATNWFRIVLDEAHAIRNQNTAVSKACVDLAAARRWAVTGTPVQNGLGDLGALIKFLKVRPFDDAQTWSREIITQLKSGNTNTIGHLRLLVDSITLRRMKDRIGLKLREELNIQLEFGKEERRIYDNIAAQSRRDFELMERGAVRGKLQGKAYTHILKSINRMRMFCAHGLDMFSEDDRKEIAEGMNPENAIAIELGDEPGDEPDASVSERQAYETLHLHIEANQDQCQRCSASIGQAAAEADGSRRVTEDFDGSATDETSSGEDGEKEKPIGYLTPCFHFLCVKCKNAMEAQVVPTLSSDERYTCPECGAWTRYGFFDLKRSAYRDFVEGKRAKLKKRKECSLEDYSGPSTKVTALMEDLEKCAAETSQLPEGEPPIRSVVFSGWTMYLDLIEIALNERGIGYNRLDGKMSVSQRSRVLEQFKTDPGITVILVSIKAGGQGLNFTAANKVFMMEPQWNPGVEQQAIDRVHRLGQKRDVQIKRYIMENTVENAVLQLQRRKEDLAKFTLERKMTKLDEAKKRLEDLKTLMR
ncbi:hypothetical protein BAUCODRAFT_472676 [Baudoinia panamericana UAMH 10762]|uniref:SNF2 family DNA-dependent ATPase domain-containing protein n=1 Tax=Baudoinia panamericana (strain UAMH 10762) TaxID=717646 RepID=M2MXS5_BAUPA|nr:uncharacterized protein BAUCODRAFT_472676 [Baudoinia panamericana UAMH 10762]EMC96373.1 hypothetical protein BAUCODRAFT_472676 [Baudoinia panamericana UAMH 10762]